MRLLDLNGSARKVKLAFIHQSNISVVGGTERVLYQYCKNVPDNFDVTVYQSDYPSGPNVNIQKELEGLGIKFRSYKNRIHKLDFLMKSSIGRILLYVLLMPFYNSIFGKLEMSRFRKELKQMDIVYLMFSNQANTIPKGPVVIGSTHNWAPERKALVGRISTLMIARGLMWHRIGFFHVFPHYSWFLKTCNKGGFFAPNGVSEDAIQENKTDKFKDFLFYAKLVECKGILLAIESIEKIRNKYPDVKLTVAGTGPLEELIKRNDGVQFLGYLSDSKLSDIRRNSSCLLYPSTCDHFSLVILESLASGLYVLASDHFKGYFDEFEKVGSLRYCSPKVESIVSTIEHLLTEVPNMDSRRQTVEIIATRYTWKSVSKNFYKEILGIVAP